MYRDCGKRLILEKRLEMKKAVLLSVFIISSIFFFVECTQESVEIKKENEIQKITNTVSSCIGWFKDKDFDLLFSIVAQDSNYISVHPNKRVIKEYEHFKKNSEIFRNPDFKYVRHKLKDLKISLSQSGDVAWFYCILDDINTWKGKPANWENTRWTGVLEKREKKWIIVQQHFSFAAK